MIESELASFHSSHFREGLCLVKTQHCSGCEGIEAGYGSEPGGEQPYPASQGAEAPCAWGVCLAGVELQAPP